MKESTKSEIIKLFWIFIIVSIFGCILETIVCIVDEGHFEVRQGVIYGPFIPVYGAGAVLFYLVVPKITGATVENAKKVSRGKVFVYTMTLGGVTEYLFSYVQECIFGTVSWEYSTLYFNLNGRTSLIHCIYWGLGGIIFIKWIYPHTKKLGDFSHMSRKAKIATAIFFIFMILNMTVSMLAGYRQYERMRNIEAHTRLQRFLDEHYPDSVMDVIFSNKQYTSQGDRKRKNNSPVQKILEQFFFMSRRQEK